MKKIDGNNVKPFIFSITLLILGILFCCSLSIGIGGLSIIIGIVLILIGIALLIKAMIIMNSGLITSSGIWGVITLSFGIVFLIEKLAGIIFVFIPWLLIVLGSVFVIDALLFRFYKNNDKLITFVVEIIIGVISLILGILLVVIDGFMEYASIVLGIIMIVYAVLLITKTLKNKNQLTVI